MLSLKNLYTRFPHSSQLRYTSCTEPSRGVLGRGAGVLKWEVCVWGCSLICMLVGGCSALKPHFQWLWGRPIIRALHWSLTPSPLRHTPTEIPSISGEWICMNVAPPTRESDKCEQLQKGLGVGRCLVLSRGNLEPVSPVWLGDRSKLL